MTLRDMARRTEKLLVDNSPAVLTALGVSGTVATAYFAGTASFKAADILREASGLHDPNNFNSRILTSREKLELTWKLYIPAITTGSLSVAAIIGANRIGTRRAAAMAAAYTLSEKAFIEYREKIVEKLGETKEEAARVEIAQERLLKNPPTESNLFVTGAGKQLFIDSLSNQPFESSMETIRRAQNDINAQIIHAMYASVADFYSAIGIPTTAMSYELGWDADNMLDISFVPVLTEDGRAVINLEYSKFPAREYNRNYR